MIQIGHWTGHYSFADEKVNKIRGFEKTFFEIEILSVSENAFTGKVQDDLNTGGTEGVGEILGKIMGDRIDFVKFMILWIAGNLSIPFWMVGHVHLTMNVYKDIHEIIASLGMNILVAIGFFIEWRQYKKGSEN
jgi:hypothetical protein